MLQLNMLFLPRVLFIGSGVLARVLQKRVVALERLGRCNMTHSAVRDEGAHVVPYGRVRICLVELVVPPADLGLVRPSYGSWSHHFMFEYFDLRS